MALHLGRMKDQGRITPELVSFGKFDNVRNALDVARTARSVLGANGITLEYPVIRHMTNLETVLTYEGTNEIHTLILGQALTGLAAFKAAAPGSVVVDERVGGLVSKPDQAIRSEDGGQRDQPRDSCRFLLRDLRSQWCRQDDPSQDDMRAAPPRLRDGGGGRS